MNLYRINCYNNDPYNGLPCLITSFCILRSGSGHHLCQSGRPRGVAAWCESALWTFRTASDRKPADASWLPNEQLLSDRTQPQRGQTASRSTSLKPRRGFEVHGFILSSSWSTSTQHQLAASHPASPCCPHPSPLVHCFIVCCHSLGGPCWSYTRQDFSWKCILFLSA